jgi:GNAT superfamily N-acetyltransferase
MDLPHLEAIPYASLPEPFRLRSYEPGDERAWLDIHRQADTYNTFTPATFQDQFGCDPDVLRRRQLYLLDGRGSPVGTATGWLHPGLPELGRIHWVAILPAYQGRGLAKPLLARTCQCLRQLGHTRAYLTTSTARVPAICLYFDFGFRPNLDGTARRHDWEDFMARTLDVPQAKPMRAFLEKS